MEREYNPPTQTFTTDIRAIQPMGDVDARYCIQKALDYIEMADVYIADLENEIETLKQQINGKTSE
jgi:hypothetical protein